MKNKSLFLRILIIAIIVIGLLSIGISVYARNVSRVLHSNLADAQTYIERAINKVSAAQRANEFDLNGYAARVKELLDQAYSEIIKAAITSNNK